MSADALELLSAFEGLETLRLKDEIRDHILLQLPSLKDRILHSQIQLEEALDTAKAASGRNHPMEDEIEIGL